MTLASNRFDCSTCGRGIAADEDGCCATCGADATAVYAPRVIVADPPWKFGDKLPGPGRGAAKHYETMSVEDICRFPLPWERQADEVLFLWRVSAMQREALDVASAWSFTVKSELVWEKLTTGGKRHFGMGRYVRASHETCLIATRGRGCLPEVRNQRSTFQAAVAAHSAKPDAFYAIVERMYPNAVKTELFARKRRLGWEQHGLELPPVEHEQEIAGGDHGP